MAGQGPAPKADRRRANTPERGEWKASPGIGWQHGNIPDPPVRSAIARETWATWFRSWFASYWTPDDLPNLRLVIKLWAKADSGKATGSERSELRQLMDSYGITPKGQQDRRWAAPIRGAKPVDEPEPPPEATTEPESPYGHLRVAK